MSSYDIAIIGAGPGGYVAAIRAARLGAKVVLIEKGELGGVCLNHGCIPTKSIIASAHALLAVKRAAEFGVTRAGEQVAIDMGAVQKRKVSIVEGLRGGIVKLLKANSVDVLAGTASFTGIGKLSVNGKAIDAKHILIATGSSWIELANLKTDGKFIVTTDEALDWTCVPKTLAIVGGGVVGCEFACAMAAFGAKVTIIEATPSILPPVEKTISRLLSRSMKQQGIDILAERTVESARVNGNEVEYSLSDGGARKAEKMIVAVGRRPLTFELDLKAAGVELNERGFIKVDGNFETSAKGIFAIGDVIGNPMLAHAASAEGIAAVEGMFGKAFAHALSACPAPIFTMPEIASVGRTSEELENEGVEFGTGRFPYAASGKAACDGETDGQALIHADAQGNILGAHIIGENATVLIAEATLAMKNGLTARELAATIHAHPTLSEVLAGAAEDVDGLAIHKAPMKGSR